MTDREKQIEEMAMSIAECNGTACDNCALKCKAYITCEILHDKGYRKMDEITLKLDLGDRTPKEIEKIAEMFNGEIKKQVAREILNDLLEHCNIEIRDSYEQSVKGSKHYGGVNNAYHQMKRIIQSYMEKYGVEIKV